MRTRGVHVLHVAVALAGCAKGTHDAPAPSVAPPASAAAPSASASASASPSASPPASIGATAAGCGARPYAASARIVLSRSACYGSCPDYRVEVHPDGTVDYTGDLFVRVFGTLHTSIPQAVATALFDHAACVPPDVLSKSYKLLVTDSPTAEVIVDLGYGPPLKVEDYPPCHVSSEHATPPELCALETAIDTAAATARWTECKGPGGRVVTCPRWAKDAGMIRGRSFD